MAKSLSATMSLVTLLAASAVANAQQLSGDDLRSEVAGKRVYLSTPLGSELPLEYLPNGSLVGDASHLGVLGSAFAPQETGRWWVEENRLCQQWPTWNEGIAMCYTLARSGPNQVTWVRDDGKTGTARIEG